ncbi:hypothetical protein [Methanosphaerula subterraneus]|uniref:hypothetical protein n=1 Tax=Methanosphaerula subterraneus TaxID=3350244 RepID=UPI003F867BFB
METFVHQSSEKTATPAGASGRSGHFTNRRGAGPREASSPGITDSGIPASPIAGRGRIRLPIRGTVLHATAQQIQRGDLDEGA